MLPQVISALVEANVSIGRLQKYLLAEEIDPFAVERKKRMLLPIFPPREVVVLR